MNNSNVKISSIVEYQLPEFVNVEYPLLAEFLKEYYRSTEVTFAPNDLLSNIANYIKIDNLSEIVDTFYLYNDKSFNITRVLKDSTTILDGQRLVKITTLQPHNFVDGDLVDIILDNSNFGPGPNDLVDLDSNLPFRGARFNVTIVNENEFFLNNSGSGISDRDFQNPQGLIGKTTKSDINFDDDEIVIYTKVNSKKSLPLSYGLVSINDEIILYKSIEPNSFTVDVDGETYPAYKLLDCNRGFSGVTSLGKGLQDELVFESSVANNHLNRSEVKNLSSIFLKQFLKKVKYQYLPGFENSELNEELNENIFIKQSRDFYSSKGTDTSFKILFAALYGENVDIIKPRDYLIEPSDANYRVVKDLVVEVLEGDPEKLRNRTLFQDSNSFIPSAKGTVSSVERIVRNEKEYYIVSIDDGYERDINFRGTLFNDFSIHPKTLSVQFIESGSTTIDVDSTIGFPESGNLVIQTIDPFTDTKLTYNISYESKTVNQFLQCKTIGEVVSNIVEPIYSNSEIYSDAYAYGFVGQNSDEIVRVRISGVLSEFEQQEKTFLYESGNKIRIRSLGLESNSLRDNKWIFNIPISYRVKEAFLEDSFNLIYRISFEEDIDFYRYDNFLVEEDSEALSEITEVSTKKTALFRFNKVMGTPLGDFSVPELVNKTLTKKYSKSSILNYPDLNIYNTNVLNTYIDNDKSTIVASASLPSYAGNLEIQDGSIVGRLYFGKQTTTGQDKNDRLFSDGAIDYSYFTVFLPNAANVEVGVKHGFYTGDEVVFRSVDPTNSPFPDGVYYVRDFRSFGDLYGLQLSSSKSNILNEKFIFPQTAENSNVPLVSLNNISGVSEGSIQFYDFSIVDFNSEDNFKPKLLGPQNLLRKISDPILDSIKYETGSGPVGIFVNGTEILNYKSSDTIFFGPIESVEVISPGYGYDVINPPDLSIRDFGGAKLKYSAEKSTPPSFQGERLKFGVTDDLNPITYGGTGGTPIIIGGKSLVLGEKQLFVGQTDGTFIRINNLILSLGGVGGTLLSIGGEGGFEARVGTDNITLGNIGSGCVIYPTVVGELEKIDILYQGFNYRGIPNIEITGGNGKNAIVEPIMESFEYFAEFLPSSTFIDTQNYTIGFSTYHNFENFEEIIYNPPKNNSLGGLESKSRYFINVVDQFTVKLHKSKEEAVSGISTVPITSTSIGLHSLKSLKNKSKIGSLNVINPGEGFTNRKTTTIPENVNIITNIVKVLNHGYSSGELIVHTSNGTPIGGIEENIPYYVTKIDDDNFRLSKTGTQDNLQKSFFYDTKQFVDFTSEGTGTHFFNYEPISVSVKGFIGVSTSGNQDLNAKIRPIFRGSIQSIFVSESGDKYGTNEILNYSRQPEVVDVKGSNAVLLPLLNEKDGSIREVIILNSGKNYISTPDLIVRGDGIGAVLTPNIVNGKIISVNIIYPGQGYNENNVKIDIVTRGEGLKVFSSIKSWNLNLLKRYQETGVETDDAGFVFSGINENYGLQYTHIHLPDDLRKIVYTQDPSTGNNTVDFDADRDIIKKHSPIVGWAYDGNPIYGPYGYGNGESGSVRAMQSGYRLKPGFERSNGPSFNIYPNGFFVEDYIYDESIGGDLDESNGRYCITPDYPNGVYAYFCTLNTNSILEDGKGYLPKFPFVVGDTFKSRPINFNFDKNSNQNSVNINSLQWYRNTSPYKLTNKIGVDYKYLLVPNRIKDPISEVKFASFGEIETVDIVVSGNDYKVGEKIKFTNADVIGQNATANISVIEGKGVREVSIARSTFNNVEFTKIDNGTELIGFTDKPHNYFSGDIVSISTPIERIVFKDVNFNNNNLFLNKPVPVRAETGITTYFEVSGDLSYPNIRENDIYTPPSLGSNDPEQVKILNIDPKNKVIRVQREYNDVASSSGIGTGSRLTENSRKFSCNLGIQTYYNYGINYEIYFDSIQVGLGTISGPGITSSVNLPYRDEAFIPIKSIFLPEHRLTTNEEIEYNTEESDPRIRYSIDGNVTNDILPERVFVVKLSDDVIGLSTVKVGLGTTGNNFEFRNIENLNDNTDPLLSFVESSGNNHKFTTLRKNLIKAKVSQNIVKVSTSSTHGLSRNDVISIEVQPKNTKEIVIEYNDNSSLLVANPKTFLPSDVDILSNLFTVINHNYITGDKILYKSESPIVGLSDNEIYYVVAINRNEFALATSFYESQKEFPEFIRIESATEGTFYSINPKINVISGQTIKFDLSSETLSFTQGSSPVRIPSFSFDLFYDSNFNHKYTSAGDSSFFDVNKIGSIGVDASASLEVEIKNTTPLNLYYKLTPLNVSGNPESKLKIFIDQEQPNNNKIQIVKSKYDGTYSIFDPIERDASLPPFLYPEFKYQIPTDPEEESYDLDSAVINYTTTSRNAFGSISKVKIDNKGRYFYKLPSKTEIISSSGTGGIVSANSKNIGTIKTVNIRDIGFDYPSDLSIRPIVKLPTIYKVEPLFSIDNILIVNNGINYFQSPNIAVVDSKTGEEIKDILLKYSLGDNFVSILQNTKNLSNIVPRLVPINNTNGIPVLLNAGEPIVLDIANNSDATEVIAATDNAELDDDAEENEFSLPDSLPFTNLTTIQVFLATEYSSIFDFPFELGDFVLIEDVVTIEEVNGGTSKGFNSSSYSYSYYKVVRRDPNIGGSGGSITLDFAGKIPDEDLLTASDSDSYKVDVIFSQAAKVVPVKYFPTYKVTLLKNDFIIDEELISDTGVSLGIVEQWDNQNDYIKISERVVFNEGDTIIGQTSKTKANLLTKIEFDAGYKTNSSSVVNKGWELETGKLNEDLQRTNDSDYYQYFSYALKSKISIDKWDETVGSLNHTAGFKRFSELEIESSSKDFSGITTSQDGGEVFGISEISSEVSVNCVYDFDLVRELNFGSNPVRSNELVFNSRILQDYIESVSNRVLNIDDISKNFNAIPRDTTFSIVSRSDSTDIRSRKFFFYAQDRRFVNDKQMSLFATIHDDVNVYDSQYGRLETRYDLAYYESDIIGTQQNLLFYPTLTEINNFLVDFIVLEMTDDPTDIETLTYGDIAYLYNQVGVLTDGTLAGSGTSIVGVGTTFGAAKILVQTGAANTSYYQFNEITLLRDGLDDGNSALLEYGEITTFNQNNESTLGIVSFRSNINPVTNEIDLIMTPYNDLTDDYNVKTITIGIANTNFTQVGSLALETGEAQSFKASGIGTDIPEPVDISLYNTQYKCSYLFPYVVGVNTGSKQSVSYGEREHGISDWYAFDDDTVTYSAIYPNTQIVGVNTLGYRTVVVETGDDPQRGTIGITSGFFYYGTKPIHLIPQGEHWKMAPVSYAGTIFGNYVRDRGFTGAASYYIYSPFENATINQYDDDANGILGIASDTITIEKGGVGVVTSGVLDGWVYFDSDVDVIITAAGPSARDNSVLAPSQTGIGTTSYKYFVGLTQIPSTENFITAYGNLPTGVTTSNAYAIGEPLIAVQASDGAGDDDIQGILPDFISSAYSWGEVLSDYQIAAPYGDTIIEVSYWNGSEWVVGETHNLLGGDFETPQQVIRDSDSGFGSWGTNVSGTSTNFADDANLWKFVGTKPFALFVNDSTDDEETLLGFSSTTLERPLNIEYRASEIQMINDQINSYITEYGVITIEAKSKIFGDAGIGSFRTQLVGSDTILQFVPAPLSTFEIRGYQINVGRF